MSWQPTLFLSDLFGTGATHLSGPSPRRFGFVPPGGEDWVGRTSVRLAIAGAMSIISDARLLLPRWMQFHRDAGLDIATRPIPYASQADLDRIVADIAHRPRSIVLDYLHPPGAIPDDAHFVERTLFSSLNNKAHLERWTEGFPVPPRRLVPSEHLLTRADELLADGQAVFLKGVCEGPSGGGDGVRRAANADDVRRHAPHFERVDEVVVEAARPFVRTFCLNYAIFGPDRVEYLGAGEQVIAGDCVYAGNWFDPSLPPPPAAVAAGASVARRAAEAGYTGIAGMDAGVLPDGGWEFIDLNFRLNGSTPALLLLPAFRRHLGRDPVALHTSFEVPHLDDRDLLLLLREQDLGHLFIQSAFAPDPPSPCLGRVKLLFVGDSREQAAERRDRIKHHFGIA